MCTVVKNNLKTTRFYRMTEIVYPHNMATLVANDVASNATDAAARGFSVITRPIAPIIDAVSAPVQPVINAVTSAFNGASNAVANGFSSLIGNVGTVGAAGLGAAGLGAAGYGLYRYYNDGQQHRSQSGRHATRRRTVIREEPVGEQITETVYPDGSETVRAYEQFVPVAETVSVRKKPSRARTSRRRSHRRHRNLLSNYNRSHKVSLRKRRRSSSSRRRSSSNKRQRNNASQARRR